MNHNTWASLYGLNLSARTEQVTALPFPTNFAGVRVVVRAAGITTDAQLHYVSPLQVNFLVPPLPAGAATATVQVVSGQFSSTETVMRVGASSPGLFKINGIRTIVTDAAGRLLEENEPLQDGEVYVMYATGLGATNPPVPVGQPAPLGLFPITLPVQLTIGSGWGEILYAGLTPTYQGLYQINFRYHSSGGNGNPYLAEGRLALGDGQSTTFQILVQ